MSYLQNFNFAWGVGIFSGGERSEIRRFLGRFRNSRDGRRGKLKHDGVSGGFFQNFHHGVGDSELTCCPVIFKRGLWPVSGCQCANPWTKSKVFRCSNLLGFQMTESPVHSGQLMRPRITLFRDLSRMVSSPFGCLKGPKTSKSSEVSTIFALRFTTTGGQVTCFN